MWFTQGAWGGGIQGRPSREVCQSWQVDLGWPEQRQGAGSFPGLEVEPGRPIQEGPSEATQELGRFA